MCNDMLVTNLNPCTHILGDSRGHMGLPTCGHGGIGKARPCKILLRIGMHSIWERDGRRCSSLETGSGGEERAVDGGC